MYKRNQIEWAIWHLIDRGKLTSPDPPKVVVHTIRRLVDVDRQLWVDKRAGEPWKHCFAFIDGVPQGRGGENSYRLEETVALWLGIKLLSMGPPQTEIVQFLRLLRPELDLAIGKVMEAYGDLVESARAKSGDVARRLRESESLPPARHVYVLTEAVAPHGVLTAASRLGSKLGNICFGRDELLEFIESYVVRSKGVVVVEIANAILSLAYFLSISQPARRGRPT